MPAEMDENAKKEQMLFFCISPLKLRWKAGG